MLLRLCELSLLGFYDAMTSIFVEQNLREKLWGSSGHGYRQCVKPTHKYAGRVILLYSILFSMMQIQDILLVDVKLLQRI